MTQLCLTPTYQTLMYFPLRKSSEQRNKFRFSETEIELIKRHIDSGRSVEKEKPTKKES